MRITAAVVEEKSGAFKLDALDLDPPRPDEVLVKIAATGICHAGLLARGAVKVRRDAPLELLGPQLLDLLMGGRFPVDRLVTFYPFDEINQAAADAVAGTTVKPVLRMPQ